MKYNKINLPKDWMVKKLGDIFTITSGTTPLRSIDNYFIDGTHLWVKTTDLNNGFISNSEEKVTDLAMKETSLKKLPIGTILIAMYGGFNQIGRTGLLMKEASINQALSAVLPKYEIIEPYFLLCWLNCKIDDWKHFAASSRKDPNITKSDVEGFPIIIPPLPEQQKIAQILITWDKAIQTTQHLLDKLESRKKGMMQGLLSGKEKGWETVRFKDCFERVTRRNDEGNTNVLTISAQRGLISQRDFFNKFVASDDVKGYFLLKNGEFSYNKSYSTGYPWGAYKRLDFYDKGILSPLYICFSLKKGCSDFFVHFFEGGFMDRGIYTIAQEGARNHGLLNMSIGDFFELKITVPSFEQQTAIAKILNTAETEIQETKAYLKTLKHQKKGLMQSLLTGKIIVKTNG